MSQRYSPEVHAFIRENVAGHTTAELAAMTNAAFGTDFDANKMKCYKNNHKLKSGTPCGLPKDRPTELYPEEIRDYIHQHYKGTSYVSMAAQLKEVFGRDYTPGQIMAYYKNHKLNSGLTGRFEKGHVPPNKGMKGYSAPGAEKGWFKKGNQPWDTVPIGTVVTKGDGYLWKKIADKPGNVVLGLVAAVLLIGAIGERDDKKQRNVALAFTAVVALIICLNTITTVMAIV